MPLFSIENDPLVNVRFLIFNILSCSLKRFSSTSFGDKFDFSFLSFSKLVSLILGDFNVALRIVKFFCKYAFSISNPSNVKLGKLILNNIFLLIPVFFLGDTLKFFTVSRFFPVESESSLAVIICTLSGKFNR